MNYKVVLVGVFAIVAAVLILDIPVVSATEINIMRPSGSNWVKQYGVSISPGNLAKIDVSVKNIGGVFWTNAKVIINVSNATASSLESVHVYKCRGLSPTGCVEGVTPDKHDVLNSRLNLEMLWNDVSSVVKACSTNPSSCKEVANLFFLFRINDNGKIIWAGRWMKVERRTYNFASPYLFEYSLDEMDLRVQTSFLIPARDFVQAYLKLPFNPAWVSGAVFTGANLLYEISASSSELQQPSPNFYTNDRAGEQISSITRDYSFVFANTSYGILNPITLNLNPTFTCGSYGCETGKGETSGNCCYDCPCSAGYYCDGGTEGVCRRVDLISLGLYETPNTAITNCNQQHVINVTARVNYAPSDMSLTKSEYKLNRTVYPTTCSEIFPDIYRCPVTVPPMPDCQAGEYRIGPNYLNFTISYSDGPGTKTKVLVVQFPDVVVGSFTCGQNGCESGLGENSDNCCYDCGCPSGYCDVADGAQPGTGTCKQDITANNLQAALRPTHFYTHNYMAGDRSDVTLQITNAPVSLEITSSSCSMGCSQNCSATCSMSCSKTSSSDPSIFNGSCLLTFLIGNYNNTRDYSLYPSMNISVSYNNGSSGDISRSFSVSLPIISVGSSWCGDGVCAPDENSGNCCYDCSCLEGYYCDTLRSQAPTAGDSCRNEDGIRLVVDGVEVSTFDYHDRSHWATLMTHVENAPRSLQGIASCMFGNGSSIYCSMNCKRFGDNLTSHILQCNLSIPVIIDYKTSPFYNPLTRQLVIGPNTMNYSVTFNNGSGIISRELSAGFTNITVNVKPRCGSGAGYLGFEGSCMPYNRTLACESGLGENFATCCCDCPCPSGQYCYLAGPYDPGACRDVGSVNLVIDRFNPQTLKCEIDVPERVCTFFGQLDAVMHVEPVANYTFVSASYKIDGREYEMWSCIAGSDEPPWNRYNCSIRMTPITSQTKLTEQTVTKKTDFSVNIQSSGLLQTTIKSSGSFQLNMVKSQALKELEEQVQALEKQKNSWETIMWVVIAILAAAAAFCACTCIPICYGSPCCPWLPCGKCWGIYSCLATGLISVLIEIISKIDEIKMQIEALNAARNPGELYIAEQSTLTAWLDLARIIAGMVCVFFVAGGGLKTKSAAAAGSGASATGEAGAGATASASVGDAGFFGGFKDFFYRLGVGAGFGFGINGDGEKKEKCNDVGCRCCFPDGTPTTTDTECRNKKVDDKCGSFSEKDKGKCIKGMYCPEEG